MNKIFPDIDFTPEQNPLRRSIWIIFICAASILLFMLGTSALHGSEGNMAESIRELSIGKDIFAPENWPQNAEKMPLWFSRWRGLAAEFFGAGEFSCRLFSAVAALFCLGGTMLLAQEFFERRTMCCTAWLLLGSYGFIYWGRHVSIFMTMTAWVIWCAVFLYRESSAPLREPMRIFCINSPKRVMLVPPIFSTVCCPIFQMSSILKSLTGEL
jgi:4-amino-4-deoxy-L-arabinose transferase-like glycosyltransferase